MDENDLALQQWIIQASLVTTLMGDKQMRRVPLRSASSLTTPKQLLQAASSSANAWMHWQYAVNEERTGWGLALLLTARVESSGSLQAGGLSLYDGLSGIISSSATWEN